jgi:hypothetical protein
VGTCVRIMRVLLFFFSKKNELSGKFYQALIIAANVPIIDLLNSSFFAVVDKKYLFVALPSQIKRIRD